MTPENQRSEVPITADEYVMRDGIIAIARLEASEIDRTSKVSALVDYLRSDEFTSAIRRMSTRIGELKNTLARERSYHDGLWRVRGVAYASVLREVAGVDDRVAALLRRGTAANDNGENEMPLTAQKNGVEHAARGRNETR